MNFFRKLIKVPQTEKNYPVIHKWVTCYRCKTCKHELTYKEVTDDSKICMYCGQLFEYCYIIENEKNKEISSKRYVEVSTEECYWEYKDEDWGRLCQESIESRVQKIEEDCVSLKISTGSTDELIERFQDEFMRLHGLFDDLNLQFKKAFVATKENEKLKETNEELKKEINGLRKKNKLKYISSRT